jgi:hypothetical protein
MAVLNQGDRDLVYAAFVALLNQTAGETVTIVRADLRAAVSAADAWADANAAAFNAALPLPARTALTARQKARILMAVIKRRYEVS